MFRTGMAKYDSGMKLMGVFEGNDIREDITKQEAMERTISWYVGEYTQEGRTITDTAVRKASIYSQEMVGVIEYKENGKDFIEVWTIDEV